MRLWSGFERLQGMLFVLPALVVLAIFLIYPAYYTIRLAFYEGDFRFGFSHYLGIDNFKQLLTNDPDFLDLSKFPPGGALINNLRWVIFYISLSLIIGLGLAVLAVRVRYERVVKTVIFVPMAISATAVGVIWLFVYSPTRTSACSTRSSAPSTAASIRSPGSGDPISSTTRSSSRTSGRRSAS